MTQGSCIPTDSVKIGDDHPNLIHNTKFRVYTDSNIEYMKLKVGQVIDSMTLGSCIPTDSVKSGDNLSLIHI